MGITQSNDEIIKTLDNHGNISSYQYKDGKYISVTTDKDNKEIIREFKTEKDLKDYISGNSSNIIYSF